MSITELFKAVGDDHIQFQNLQQSLIKASGKKEHSEITFGSGIDKCADLLAGNESKYVGLVVWLPRDRIPATKAG